MIEGTLYPSTNRGRFQVGNAADAPDLTGGDIVDVWINRQWIRGRIEHAPGLYVVEDVPDKVLKGYYVIFNDGSFCGLCAEMRVRIR